MSETGTQEERGSAGDAPRPALGWNLPGVWLTLRPPEVADLWASGLDSSLCPVYFLRGTPEAGVAILSSVWVGISSDQVPSCSK